MFDFFKKKRKEPKRPEINQTALALREEAIKLREHGDYSGSHKKLTMSLSYQPLAETRIERAKTSLADWRTDMQCERNLSSVFEDLKQAVKMNQAKTIESQVQEVRAQIKVALVDFAGSIVAFDGEREDLQRCGNDLRRLLGSETGLRTELERAIAAAERVLQQIKTQHELYSLESVFEYLNQPELARFYEKAGAAAHESDLVEFEKHVGFSLPDEFRKYTLSPLGGLYLAVREEQWPRPNIGDIGPFWSCLYGIKVFGLNEEIPKWLDLRVQHDELQSLEVMDLVPFLQIEGDSDAFCFDRHGKIIHWRHEDPDKREVVDMAFSSLLMNELRELEMRRKKRQELSPSV